MHITRQTIKAVFVFSLAFLFVAIEGTNNPSYASDVSEDECSIFFTIESEININFSFKRVAFLNEVEDYIKARLPEKVDVKCTDDMHLLIKKNNILKTNGGHSLSFDTKSFTFGFFIDRKGQVQKIFAKSK